MTVRVVVGQLTLMHMLVAVLVSSVSVLVLVLGVLVVVLHVGVLMLGLTVWVTVGVRLLGRVLLLGHDSSLLSGVVVQVLRV